MNESALWGQLPEPLTGKRTHADHGEDVILKVLFDTLRVDKPSYLDVGAFDPFHINNTVLLYDTGSRGVNVEANPRLMEAFYTHRPEDLNINCIVGPERQPHRSLYIPENPGLSSLHRELVDEPFEVITVPTWTIPDILVGHTNGKWPDLLSIDIEGEDFAVLDQCLPSEGDRPTVVCVEFLRCTEDYSQQWRGFMPSRRYALFCRTRSNMIWVRAEDRDRLL
jgi:FkbM family methyltransferase